MSNRSEFHTYYFIFVKFSASMYSVMNQVNKSLPYYGNSEHLRISYTHTAQTVGEMLTRIE